MEVIEHHREDVVLRERIGGATTRAKFLLAGNDLGHFFDILPIGRH
jgi:hypothetical protein